MTSPLARRLEQEQCPLQVTFGKGRFSRRDSFTWEVFICRGMKGSHSSTGGQSSPRERAPSQKTGWPRQTIEEEERSVWQVETSFLSRQEKEDYLRPDCLLYLFKKMEESIRSRREGGAPPNLQKEKSGPPPSLQNQKVSPPPRAPKQEEIPPQLALVRKLLLQESLDLLVSLHLL